MEKKALILEGTFLSMQKTKQNTQNDFAELTLAIIQYT